MINMAQIPTPRISTDTWGGASKVFTWEYYYNMKFKVGDKVRVTRDGLSKQAESSFVKSYEISWWVIKKIVGEDIYCPNDEYWYEEKYLELVTEEEFERWEMVEVWSYKEEKRVKRFFLCEAIWAKYPYICVDIASEMKFKNWEEFQTGEWDKIRKISKLTRKEIAEKFGVAEDFVLVD